MCDALVCLFGCVSICGCKNIVCRKLVFFPPRAMYELEDRKDLDGTERQVMWILDDKGQRVADSAFSNKNFRVEFIPNGNKGRIAVMTIRHPKAKHTIFFSHGNATDIGCMRDHLIDMAIQLEANVWCYDYSGYGLSTGEPSVANTLADGETVYKYMTSQGGIKADSVILYGQSLGTAPTLYLAKKYRNRGVVIHSGMMSGLRVIRDVKNTKWFDILTNIDNIKSVQDPVFIIHGQQDEEVPCHHGHGLAEATPVRYEPWYPLAGHNNIEIICREEYFERLRAFIAHLDKSRAT